MLKLSLQSNKILSLSLKYTFNVGSETFINNKLSSTFSYRNLNRFTLSKLGFLLSILEFLNKISFCGKSMKIL
jgi:hypothetical protein